MYGWWALGFSVASILLYFAGLMCTHLAAFRCAANMRKRATEHLMHTGLGYFDTHASGALRRVVDGCAAETEGMLAHKLPDTAGSVAMIVGMLVLFFVFDWRLGLACLVPVAILLAPGEGDFGAFLANFAFYAIFSAVIPTTMTRVMFMSDALQSATDAVNRVEEVLTAPTIKAPVAPKEPVDNSIAFEDVSFTYEGANEPALSHVSFSVPAGSTVALVGPSGGGKTTAASLVPRFWDACVGRVLVGGVDVRSMEPRRLMEHVAFVFQTNRLFKQSVLENVRAARPDATREEVVRALSAAQCDDIIEKLPDGVDTVYGAAGAHFSGGERQRISIARALLKGAPIVLLDEATASLDVENETEVQQALSRLLAGKTVIVIAHRMRTVTNADKVVVLDSERVIEQGTPTGLMERDGLFARMVRLQQESAQWAL